MISRTTMPIETKLLPKSRETVFCVPKGCSLWHGALFNVPSDGHSLQNSKNALRIFKIFYRATEPNCKKHYNYCVKGTHFFSSNEWLYRYLHNLFFKNYNNQPNQQWRGCQFFLIVGNITLKKKFAIGL